MQRTFPLTICLGLAACSTSADPPKPAPALSASAAPASSATATATATAAASASAVVKRRPPAREGSTIARAIDGGALYVADEDRSAVQVVSLPLLATNRALPIPMPGQPAQVLAIAGRVLVTIRSAGAAAPGKAAADAPASAGGPGLLMVMRKDADRGLVEEARVELPADAWGVAVTPDGGTALVTSAWTHQVSAVDLATNKVTWSVNVAREPRGIVVRSDGRAAYVTHLVGANLTRINDIQSTPKVRSVGLLASPLRAPVGTRLGASLAYAAALSPDGRRLFVPRHALGALGSEAWFGATTVDVLLTSNDTNLAPMRGEGGLQRDDQDLPTGYFDQDPMGVGHAPGADPMLFTQPRAIAYVHARDTILVAAEGHDTLVELDARAVDPSMHMLRKIEVVQAREKPIPVAKACGAPTGIALSEDEATAYVHCRTTADVVAISLEGPADAPRPMLRLAEDPLPALASVGRRLFFDATDAVMSGGLACAGCHPEGRDDGHVWHETKSVPPSPGQARFVSGTAVLASTDAGDAGYARQTPMLAGRVDADGPYGWHGESATLVDRIRGGFALHRWRGFSGSAKDHEDRAQAIAAYLRAGLVPPPRRAKDLTPKEKRGQEIFLSDEAQCWTCHPADTGYTNRKPFQVFPSATGPEGFTVETGAGFKTPSLRFVAGTPPFSHDGRFPTLAALVDGNEDAMGKTSHLSAADKAALVAFLETL